MYADDICVYSNYHLNHTMNFFASLNQCLAHLTDWFNVNRLKLNSNKTQVFLCGNKNCIRSLDLDSIFLFDEKLNISSNVKYLGVDFDASL